MNKWQMVDNLAQYMMSNKIGLRCGQAVYNALSVLDPQTANRICGTNDDCFYNDNKIENFKNKTIEIWKNKERFFVVYDPCRETIRSVHQTEQGAIEKCIKFDILFDYKNDSYYHHEYEEFELEE